MWLRHTDGKLSRDGISAALLRRIYVVDERGRVTAHQDWRPWSHNVFLRGSEGLLTTKKGSENG
jgi:hypothetical protein